MKTLEWLVVLAIIAEAVALGSVTLAMQSNNQNVNKKLDLIENKVYATPTPTLTSTPSATPAQRLYLYKPSVNAPVTPIPSK